MNMEDEELIDEIAFERNLSRSTKITYKCALESYVSFQKKDMVELINEADDEEEHRVREKDKKIKKRLMKYRSHLYTTMKTGSAKQYLTKIKTIYRHYGITIPELPLFSSKQGIKAKPITFKELPTHEIIKKALKISDPLMTAIILFMSSSGTARAETLSLTVGDFIDATKEYHGKTDIYEVIDILKNRDDIIPLFYLRRIKTDKYYHTCCSPEATNAIIFYLLSRTKEILTCDTPLFGVSADSLDKRFKRINNALNLGRVGTYNRFRSHNMRKFNSSRLQESGLGREYIDELQGRGKDPLADSYLPINPDRLREMYIKHMGAVTINLDVNNIDIKSPEYIELETKYENEKSENELLRDRIGSVESQISSIKEFMKLKK